MPGAAGGVSLRDGVREPPVARAYAGRSRVRESASGVSPRRGRVQALIATARPRQWIKNVLVIAAAGAAGALGHDDVPVRVALAFVAFCLLASGIYAINDVRDAAEDRLHPRKRFRPVAAGELDARQAITFGVVLIGCGLTLCIAIRPLLGVVGAGYVALTLSYTLVWRHIVILDLFAIAGGFVLRAVAGGVAAPVTLSHWFVLVVTFAAVFIATGKRVAELRRSVGERGGGRRTLEGYSPELLQMILAGSAALALFAYCMWAFLPVDIDWIPWRELTIVPIGVCLTRYYSRVRRGDGEAPEEIVLGDRVLLAAGFAWVILFAVSVHVSR